MIFLFLSDSVLCFIKFGLGRALYMPDKLNLHIGAGEKKKASPCHFPTVVPELIQSLLWKVASFLFHWE